MLSPLGVGDSNWTYAGDDHVEASTALPVVFMGINAGSGNHATTRGMTRSEETWRTRCARLSKTAPHRIVFAELIAVPTHTVGDLDAIGSAAELMRRSAGLNAAVLAHHDPQIVFQAGLSGQHVELARELYELEPAGEGRRRSKPSQLLFQSYRRPGGKPWIVFRHFAAFGFSTDDAEDVQREAERLGWRGDDQPSS